MWALRKFYAGNGGVLPPTDQRVLNMTPYQIELDYEHMLIDAKLKKGGEAYEDDGFEKYDKESEDTDNLLSDMPTFGKEASDPHKGLEELPKSDGNTTSGAWEDVEIDVEED